jgi:hypothetical protein
MDDIEATVTILTFIGSDDVGQRRRSSCKCIRERDMLCRTTGEKIGGSCQTIGANGSCERVEVCPS